MKKHLVSIMIASVFLVFIAILRQRAHAQNVSAAPEPKTKTPAATVAKTDAEENSPIYVTEIPRDYRDWKLISVAHEAGDLNDIRGILGNDIAIKAYREGKLPFPEGAIVGRIAWSHVPSEENNKTFGRVQSFVAGAPTDFYLQFMVKDSKKYAATGGWGYSSFGKDRKPTDAASMQSCYPCHQAIKDRDFIFTRYAP
jgi:hypothetical protein